VIPLDPRKYFIIGFAALFLATAGAALSYRASYRIELAQRQQIEASLARTVASLDELARSSRVALDEVNRASAATRDIAAQRGSQRERILRAPNDQDGPVAPVLRDAIVGVRQP
jgi:hypothetical protein